MNRAAFAARMFFVITLLPAVGAAGYAAYQYHAHSLVPEPPPHYSKKMRVVIETPKVKAKPLSKSFLLGVFAGRHSTLAQFDKAIGTRANLSVMYLMWGTKFPAYEVAKAASEGAETVVELQPGKVTNVLTMEQITAGVGDKWLNNFARSVAKLRDHIIFSFAPEMNGKFYIYGSENVSGKSYISAYRHVYRVLAKSAAGKYITFMWQPSAIHRSTPDPSVEWPGSRYVDLIGLDGYYYYKSDTFAAIFGKTLAELGALAPTTPIMLGETASAPNLHRQRWDIRNLFSGVESNHLVGLIWFDSNQLKQKESAATRRYHQDWRLEDSPRALSVFRTEISKHVITQLVAIPKKG